MNIATSLASYTLTLTLALTFPSPVLANPETSPTPTSTTANTITPQITPFPTRPSPPFQADPTERSTLLSLLGLVAIIGLVLFLTRPK